MAREQAEERLQIPFYFERFQEERDKRFSSEIARLEAEIRHNGQQIAELKADVARLDEKVEQVRAELKADIARLDEKVEQVRAELKADIAQLQARLDSQFRWIVALLFPIILGVVAIIIQNLLKP